MVNIDWNKLVTLDYWLEGIAGDSFGAPFIEVGTWSYWFYLYFFSTLIVIGILWKVYRAFLDSEHPIQKKIPFWSSSLVWLGLIGLFWFLMRQIDIGLLGARLWLLVMGGYVLVVMYFAADYFRKYYPIEINYYKQQKKSRSTKSEKPA
jgi:hypothetical protein